jgi:hypothetical protein
MGHIRLGRLYKSRKWNQVIDLLESDSNESQLTGAVLDATERQLRQLSFDPAIGHVFWLLVRTTWAARSDAFHPFLSDIGIDLKEKASIFTLTSALSDHLQKTAAEYSESGVFAGLANLSFVDVITETVAERPKTLFGSNLEDIQDAFKAYSSQKQFGIISRRFFAHFLSRTIKYFLNKEISNHVGADHRLRNIQSAKDFNDALGLYAYQSAKIMEDFAGGWYSKHNWEQRGEITERDASNFVAFALKKLRMELGQEYRQELS